MGSIAQDLRYAVRMLRKNSISTLAIVLSLAIGIGANSAVFSVVDALLLRPLPYPHPDRLAAIWLHSPGIGIFRDWPSPQRAGIRDSNHGGSGARALTISESGWLWALSPVGSSRW